MAVWLTIETLPNYIWWHSVLYQVIKLYNYIITNFKELAGYTKEINLIYFYTKSIVLEDVISYMLKNITLYYIEVVASILLKDNTLYYSEKWYLILYWKITYCILYLKTLKKYWQMLALQK